MNFEETTSYLRNHAVCGNRLISRISSLLKDCECFENMMVGIYLIDNNQFLFYNTKLEKLFGTNYKKLFEEGWDFWFSLIDSNESLWIRNRLTHFLKTTNSVSPLVLRYHITDFNYKRLALRHEICLHEVNQQTIAFNYFFDVTDKEVMNNHLKAVSDKGIALDSESCRSNVSRREEEVLRLIANGFSSKQIADMLFISNHTAISHRKNLIEKFGVKNTAQLIKMASQVMEL